MGLDFRNPKFNILFNILFAYGHDFCMHEIWPSWLNDFYAYFVFSN